MIASQAQRSRFLSTLLFGLGTWVLVSRVAPAFVGVAPVASPSMRGSVAMNGFKEEFDAWRSSLSKEEKELMAEQAEKVFDKKFLKTERAKEQLPKAAKESFSKVLGKFFDNEDYKKDSRARIPDYDALKGKVAEQAKEFNLRPAIVEIDRDADRRYDFAARKIREAEAKGEYFPNSSPRKEALFMYNTGERKEQNMKAFEAMKEVFNKMEQDGKKMPKDLDAELSDFESKLKNDEPIKLTLYSDALQQMMQTSLYFEKWIASVAEDETLKAELEKEDVQKNLGKLMMEVCAKKLDEWYRTMKYVSQGADNEKKLFRSQRPNPDGKITKADVLKEIWAEIPKQLGETPPPLDEELLAELAEQPAGDGYIHPWGTADKLYKSEAVDTFGARFLLGVFETKEEARAAFKEWNNEYEQARADMKDEFEAYGKRENARVEADTSARDRILAVLDETRSKLNR